MTLALLCSAAPMLVGDAVYAQSQAWAYTGVTDAYYAVCYGEPDCGGRYWYLQVMTPWASRRGSEATFSPDGQQFAFTRDRDILVASMTVSDQQLTSTGNNWDPAWSPDGAKIAFVSMRSGRTEIYLMNPDGSNAVQLTNAVANSVARPTWSPDGVRLAFTCQIDVDNDDICRINRDGSGFTRLTMNLASDADPAWSPVGEKIAFSTTRFDGTNPILAVMNADGTQVAPIGSGIPGKRPAWSSDASYLAFAWYVPDYLPYAPKYGIYSMRADGTEILFLGGDGDGGYGGAYDADLVIVSGGAIEPVGVPTTSTVSPDGATVPTSSSRIIDNSGAIWTIGSNGAILRNGIQAAGGWGSKILWTTSTIYVYGTDGNWWRWTGNGWLNVGPAMPGGGTTGGTASSDGTTVPTTATQILDSDGAVWTIASNGAILRDGIQAAGGWGSKILWTTSTIYVYGTDGNWWLWTGTQWLNVGTVI